MDTFGQDIWIRSSDETPETFGFRYPLRMVVVRLADGGLWIWSPVGLTEGLRAEVDALGPVRFLVSPNKFHHLSLSDWQDAYPEAQVVAAPGLEAKRPDLRIDHVLEAGPAPWGDEIEQVLFTGNPLFEEAVFFHRSSGTVIFCDILQRIPEDMLTGWRLWVARLDRMVGPEPQVPRKFRVSFRDKAALRDAMERVQRWPAKQVLIAHGAPVTQDVEVFLVRAFGWVRGARA